MQTGLTDAKDLRACFKLIGNSGSDGVEQIDTTVLNRATSFYPGFHLFQMTGTAFS